MPLEAHSGLERHPEFDVLPGRALGVMVARDDSVSLLVVKAIEQPDEKIANWGQSTYTR